MEKNIQYLLRISMVLNILDSDREVVQSCLTLCDLMDSTQPSSSVHGIFQARILEWVAISFSRGSSRPRDQTRVSHIVGALPSEPPGKALNILLIHLIPMSTLWNEINNPL